MGGYEPRSSRPLLSGVPSPSPRRCPIRAITMGAFGGGSAQSPPYAPPPPPPRTSPPSPCPRHYGMVTPKSKDHAPAPPLCSPPPPPPPPTL